MVLLVFLLTQDPRGRVAAMVLMVTESPDCGQEAGVGSSEVRIQARDGVYLPCEIPA